MIFIGAAVRRAVTLHSRFAWMRKGAAQAQRRRNLKRPTGQGQIQHAIDHTHVLSVG